MLEISAGAVVYTHIDNELHYLVIKDFHNNYGFPKGHLEQGETVSEAAKREIKEETGIDIKLNPYFIEETDSIVPQSIIDIKVNSGNFVIQRENAKVYDIYEKLQFLGEGSFGSVYKVKRKKSGTREIIRALKEISKEKMCLNEESSEEMNVSDEEDISDTEIEKLIERALKDRGITRKEFLKYILEFYRRVNLFTKD